MRFTAAERRAKLATLMEIEAPAHAPRRILDQRSGARFASFSYR